MKGKELAHWLLDNAPELDVYVNDTDNAFKVTEQMLGVEPTTLGAKFLVSVGPLAVIIG